MFVPTPLSVLRLAESVPETAENFQIIRELKKALETLVNIAAIPVEDEPEHDGWDRLHFDAAGCDGSLHSSGDCLGNYEAAK